jgi:hypothetical protein
MVRVSEQRGRASAEKRNERNEPPMSGVPAKMRSIFVGCMGGVPAKTHCVCVGCMCTRAKRR